LSSNSGVRSALFKNASWYGLCCGLIFFVLTPAFAADNPRAWLGKMAEAVESLNYQGTLVYMRPGKAETFQVFHRVKDGVATERVVAMDGDGSEISRTLDEVICIFPASKKVVVDKRGKKSGKQNPLQANLPEYDQSMDAQYDLEIERNVRVAGRSALIVSIRPQDMYRYEHRIWLDEQTAMPLKTQLIGHDDKMPVEELFFTSILLPDLVSEELVRPSLNTDGYTWVRHGGLPKQSSSPVSPVSWVATKLPAGFMLTANTLEYMAHSEEPRIHLVYSDGLASVSVFVDIGVAASEQVEGLTTMGAANAYSIMVDGLLVTAMGEVPAQTVHQIATSMQLQNDSS
jgi:sigma-E factor negative regulatory protein RseB